MFIRFQSLNFWFIVLMSGLFQTVVIHATEPATTKALNLPLSAAITTLDPGLAYEYVDVEVIEQLFLSLTDFNPNNYQITAALATDWQSSTDGKTYIYHLRQDAKWLNGQPVTAHDVVWAIKRNLRPETNALSVAMLFVLKNAEAIYQHKLAMTNLGVQAIDDYTLKFSLERPMAYFPTLTSFAIYNPLPSETIYKYKDQWTQPQNIQTNGSYQLKTWKINKQLLLEKNATYYAAEYVDIAQVYYHIVLDSALAFAMYQKNELDVIGGQAYVPISDFINHKIKINLKLQKQQHLSPAFCTEWYGFSVQTPPLDNVWVRKAIAAAIDKKTLIDVILKENHDLANTFTPPPLFGAVDRHKRPKVGIAFDPIDARAWLAKGGYPQGKNFPPLFLMHNQSEAHASAAAAIKIMLKHHLNINVEVRGLEFERYLTTLKNADYPLIFRMVSCSDYPDADNWLHPTFHPTKGINWIGWQHKKFGKIVDKAQRIIDPLKRQHLYRRAEQILTETEAAIIPLYFKNDSYLVKPWLKNWQSHGFGGQHIRDWILK